MTPRQKSIFMSVFVLAGMLASLAYHFHVSHDLHLGYPYSTFLFRPWDRFMDFLDIFNVGSNPYGELKPSRTQFPLFVLLARVLYLIQHQVLLLEIYTCAFPALLAILIWIMTQGGPRKARLLVVISFVAGSFPVIFSMDRGNIENYIFLLVFASVILLRRKYPLAAALLMGAAIALKPYSAFFLPLFLSEGQILPALAAGGLASLLTLGSLLILPGTFPGKIENLRATMDLYNHAYVVRNEGLYFGSSLFGALKVAAYGLGGAFHLFPDGNAVDAFTSALMRPYFLITNAVFLLILTAILIYRTTLWRRTAILAACLTLLPYVGADYRLLYFFIPISAFLVETEQAPKDRLYATLFSLILIPTGYIHFSFPAIFHINPGEVSDSVVIQPLVITILLTSLIVDLLRQKIPNDEFLSLFHQFKRWRNREAI